MSETAFTFANLDEVVAKTFSQQKHSDPTPALAVYEVTPSMGEGQTRDLTELKEVASQLSLKCETEPEEKLEVDSEFQENEDLTESRVNDNLYRSKVPAYSILVYKPDLGSSLDNSGKDLEPYVTKPTIQQSSIPLSSEYCTAQIFTVAPSQVQPQTHILGTMGQSQDTGRVNQEYYNSQANSQSRDTVWLQILSNILARSSENKVNSDCPMSYNFQSNIPHALVGQMPTLSLQNVETRGSQLQNSQEESGLMGNESVTMVPLTQLTSTVVTQTNQNLTGKGPKAEFILLSPVTASQAVHQGMGSSNDKLEPTRASCGLTAVAKQPVTSHHLNLNSSGEESQMTSPLKSQLPPIPLLNQSVMGGKIADSLPLLTSSPLLGQSVGGEAMRENHNMKERRRRARIKDACNLMRQLVPGMSHKTDKATVFEFSARYIHFLKSFVGTNNDKEFLVKYNPY